MIYESVSDIPRVYTALAEWGSCLVYISLLRKWLNWRKLSIISVAAILVQSSFLVLSKGLPLFLWIPAMGIAIVLMFMFIYIACDIPLLDVGYYTIRAFMLAEFTASIEWQIQVYFFNDSAFDGRMGILVLILVYCIILGLAWGLERNHVPSDGKMDIRQKELFVSGIVCLLAFGFSNMSFVIRDTPFSGQGSNEIFNIRTLVDIWGIAVLYAYHMQCAETRARIEIDTLENILKNQYAQYQHSKETIEIINYRYHDLKNHIIALKGKRDEEMRQKYLCDLEAEIQDFEASNKTGNSILDTVLTSKRLYCQKNDICLTCVAEGKVLETIELIDVCTIFGNALDNAIECVIQISDIEKRLIHLTLVQKKNFLVIKCENFSEQALEFASSLPSTTKNNKELHGYGLKSIRYAVQKYGGTMDIVQKGSWVELQILIPCNKLRIS